MFKYRKTELIVYILLTALSILFSALLLAKGYSAWFLFAVAAVIVPCVIMTVKIFTRNYMLASAETFLRKGDYSALDSFAAKHEDRYSFLKVYRVDSLLERGEPEKFLKEYSTYLNKHTLPKDWMYRLEAYKVFCDLLRDEEISVKTASRLESEVSAEEVSRERCIIKIIDYYGKEDYDRAVKQIGWYGGGEPNAFLSFTYEYARCLVERKVNGSAAETEQLLQKTAYNDFLKSAVERLVAESPAPVVSPTEEDGKEKSDPAE